MSLLFLDELTDKDEQHSYGRIYERYLPGRKTVLEIGVQRGGSVLTWLAAGAEVWGIDLEKPPQFLRHPKVHLCIGNAYTEKAIQHFSGQTYDMIVEDGSHKPEDILWAAKHYTSLLSERGVMVIEDIPNDEVVQELKKIEGFYTVEYDLRRVKGRWDDRVVVLERKNLR